VTDSNQGAIAETNDGIVKNLNFSNSKMDFPSTITTVLGNNALLFATNNGVIDNVHFDGIKITSTSTYDVKQFAPFTA